VLTIGSLFAGACDFLSLGLETAGLGPTLWQVEIDDERRANLARHWPGAERFADVRQCDTGNLEPVSIIVGSFPCQDNSSARNAQGRQGLAGHRSGLWGQFARIISETRPAWIVVENVESGAHLWVDAVVRDLAERGYDSLPIPLSAADVGAPHIRRRVFIVGRNSDRIGQPVVPVDAEARRMPTTARALPGWSKPPCVSVADGTAAELGAVGDSGCPRCAEVLGWVIRELTGL